MTSLGFFAKSKFDGNLYKFLEEDGEFIILWQGDKLYTKKRKL